jgi:hypothetical protein
MDLKELQDLWEYKQTLITEFQPVGAYVRVTVDPKGRYSVFRYFQIANKWEVSVDQNAGTAEAAFNTLKRVL